MQLGGGVTVNSTWEMKITHCLLVSKVSPVVHSEKDFPALWNIFFNDLLLFSFIFAAKELLTAPFREVFVTPYIDRWFKPKEDLEGTG